MTATGEKTDVGAPLPARGVVGPFAKGRRSAGRWYGEAKRWVSADLGIYKASPDAAAAIMEIVVEENSSACLLNELEVGYRNLTHFYVRLTRTTFAIFATGLLVSMAIALVFRGHSAGMEGVPAVMALTAAAIHYFVAMKAHNRTQLTRICALAMLGALNSGCASLRNVADARLRDRFAKDLHANVALAVERLKVCNGPGAHKRRVRGNARAFRNALLSRLQDVASQDPEVRSQLVRDLARVIVRVSDGRWDLIDGIAREDPAPRFLRRLARWSDIWVTDAAMKPNIVTGIFAVITGFVAALGSLVIALMSQK